MRIHPAQRVLGVLAPLLVALLLAVLVAARQTPPPTPTGPPPSTSLRPPAYVPVPAGFPTSTS